MIVWSLDKIAMNRTSNYYFSSSINILSFKVIIFTIMHFLSFFYKLGSSTFLLVINSRYSSTYRTIRLFSYMIFWQLLKFTMYRANYSNFSTIIYILNFTIIIFISMYLFSFFDKFLCC